MAEHFEEESLGKAYDARLMKRLLSYTKPYTLHLLIALLLTFLITVSELALPYIIKIAIDQHFTKLNLNPKENISQLFFLSFIFLVVLTGGFILKYWQINILLKMGQKVIFTMRTEVFSHIQKLAPAFFDKNPVGRLVTRVTNDTEALNEMYSNVLVNFAKDLFIIIGIMGIMLFLNLKLALISFVSIPLILLSTTLYRKIAREAYRLVRIRLARINAFLSENITGMRLIQVFQRQHKQYKEFEIINKEHFLAGWRELQAMAIFRPTMDLIYSFTLSLLLWFGSRDIIHGTIEFGVLFVFIDYTKRFFQPINDLTEKYTVLQAAMASSERIFQLLDKKEFIPEPNEPITVTRLKGKIEFDHVWFKYKRDTWVLKDLNFTINPGETVAFVGATGAGKSSIIQLINRFYDVSEGAIRIDGINIKELTTSNLRQNIGIVLQDVFLFAGDILSNIRLYNEKLSLDEVKKITELIGANHFIERLPDGYYEEVKERGSTLSQGEKQLLAFARTLAYNPAILIMDEATANIDTETEKQIQDALEVLRKNRTTIIIAHRLATIQNADQIYVLNKGRIVERGTHQELLGLEGLYYKLYQLQLTEEKLAKK